MLTCLLNSLVLTKSISIKLELFYFSQACSEDVFKIFQSQPCDSYRFISYLMDIFSMDGVHQQAEQPNYLAGKVKPYCKS